MTVKSLLSEIFEILIERSYLIMNNLLYNLRNKLQQPDGPDILWVSFETFLYKDLIFVPLHLSGKEASLMKIFNCKVTESSVRLL